MTEREEELSVEDVLRSIVEDGYLSETKANRAREALARKAQEPIIPAGYALVPIEPTPAMIEAAIEGWHGMGPVVKARNVAWMVQEYKAMLAAAKEANHV